MLIHAMADISEEEYNKIVGAKTGQLSYFTSDDEPMKSIYVDLKRTDELNVDTKDIELFNKDIKPGQVVQFRFDPNTVDATEADYIRELLSTTYPDCIVIGIVKDMELLVNNPEQAVDMLEKMIAHIKVQSGINRPDIVIPK